MKLIIETLLAAWILELLLLAAAWTLHKRSMQ